MKVDESADLSVQMKEVRPLIALEHFNVETIKGKNSAAAGVTGFILNIVIYYDIVVTVEPKRKALAEANAQLEAANTKLAEVNALVKDLTEKLAVLTKELNEAMADKAQVRSRRPVVWRRLHFVDVTRGHQTRSGLVSFSSLRPIETAMLHAGRGRCCTTILRRLAAVAPLDVGPGLGGLGEAREEIFCQSGRCCCRVVDLRRDVF